MGATFNTGYLENLILYNGSNNIGIGTSADATYKVTLGGSLLGTSALFSSSLTATQGKFSGSRPQGIFTENGTSGLYVRDATGSSYKSWSIGTNDIVVGFAITPSTAAGGTTFTTPSFVINESGNVGIGTSSPSSQTLLHLKDNTNGYVGLRLEGSGTYAGSDWIMYASSVSPSSADDFLGFYNNSSTDSATVGYKMAITKSGNVGIGTSSPSSYLDIRPSTYNRITSYFSGSSISGWTFSDGNGIIKYDAGGNILTMGANWANDGTITFETKGSERMRITSGGYLKASNNGTYINGATSTYHSLEQNGSDVALYAYNSYVGNGQGILTRVYNNNTDSSYFLGYSSSAADYKIRIYSNGNIQNSNNSYGQLSDIKLKENIYDATPKLEDLLKVRIVNFNFINDKQKQIGVIAQELENIFPSMIDIVNDLDEHGKELGTVTKSVKYSVFVPMLIKAIQELKAEIDTLKK